MKTKTFVIFIAILFGGALALAAGVSRVLPTSNPDPVPEIDPTPTTISSVQDAPTPPTKPTLGGTPVENEPRVVYRFRQSPATGDLWAIPTEPVHPDTRGMFVRRNDLGGWNSTSSDTCWIAYPVENIAGRFFDYRDGETGNYHRVNVNEVLDAAVGSQVAVNPVDVPIPEPLTGHDILGAWQNEIEESQREPYEFNLGKSVADRIRGGTPVSGIEAHQLVECQDGSGENCFMNPPTPLFDSWNDDRDRCLNPPTE